MADGLVCWSCGTRLDDVPLPISRTANCPDCYTELHCCRMCIDYDPGVADGCRDDRADPPHNKEGVNFCEFFRPRSGLEAVGKTKDDAARAKLDALFRDAALEPDESDAPERTSDDPRAKLDALFKPDDE